jgi:hypothetical protein
VIGSIGWITGTSCEHPRSVLSDSRGFDLCGRRNLRVVMRSLSVFRALPSDQARK